MRNLHNVDDAATSFTSSRVAKPEITIKTNRTINFLLGIITVLLCTFIIMELTTPVKDLKFKPIKNRTFVIDDNIGEIQAVPNKPEATVAVNKKQEHQKQKVSKIKPPVIIENDEQTDEQDDDEVVTDTEVPSNNSNTTPSNTESNEKVPVVKEPYNTMSVSEVPLFPGCKAKFDREERIDCLNKKMGRFVQRKFDTELASQSTDGQMVSITVLFTIGTDGLPKDLVIKAPNQTLEKEARRVISNLPAMIPGKVEGVAVDTRYALPIKFRTENR